MSSVREQIEAIYQREPHRILPFVGSAYTRPTGDELRIMTIGINAYISPKDWAPEQQRPHPGWFRGWFEKGVHRFSRTVLRDANTLADLAVRTAPALGHLRHRGIESVFHTNAIKVYMPEARGKRASQLGAVDFERHLPQWRDLMRTLAEHEVLPHVVLVFGAPFWSYAWRFFHPEFDAPVFGLDVVNHCSGHAEARHWFFAATIRRPAYDHPLILLRVRHPSGRTRKGSPPWLAENREVLQLLRTGAPAIAAGNATGR